MIRGTVTSERDAIVPLTIYGPAGQQDVSAVVDTGFTGFLAIPNAIAADLGLPLQLEEVVILGDGQEAVLPTYVATVKWGARLREVNALGIEGSVLIGMSLLEGCCLTIRVTEGGSVEIENLR